MFVILVYDVHVKRVNKMLKLVRRYLVHVQKSVFEGGVDRETFGHAEGGD